MPQRYLVPQFIEMADRIVGPLTLVQFLYVLAGGILCYFFWTFFDKILSIPLSIIVGSFFLAMAFLKINDQPFPKMLLAAIFYLVKPKERAWKKIKELPEIKVEDKHIKEPVKFQRPAEEKVKSQLAELATIVDARGWSKETGAEIGPGEEAFRMRVKSHEEAKPEYKLGPTKKEEESKEWYEIFGFPKKK